MKGENMEKQLSPKELAEIKAQFETIKSYGVTPDQFISVTEGIITGDLTDKKYKASDTPLAQAEDKQKEARRIINNFSTALKALMDDQKAGKDDGMKTTVKLTIIVAAAKSGLSALGLKHDEINTALGITGALKKQ